MLRTRRTITTLIVMYASLTAAAQVNDDIESPKHKAWSMLQSAAVSRHVIRRTDAIRALGLIENDQRARRLAEHALTDPKLEVRAAAATALGKMHARESIPRLQTALLDPKIQVALAAAQALRELNDETDAYLVYYDLLTGARKAHEGLIAQQIDTLKNPRELAKIGFSEGIGYIPFAGIGWDAYRTIHKKDPNPVRATAATFLAHDPDPLAARALAKATHDKDWIVRAAAVEAIAQRGDPSLLPDIEKRLADRNQKVRFTAAAASIRLISANAPSMPKDSNTRAAKNENSK